MILYDRSLRGIPIEFGYQTDHVALKSIFICSGCTYSMNICLSAILIAFLYTSTSTAGTLTATIVLQK